MFSCWVMSNSLWPNGLHHARLPCPSLSPRICSNSCPLSQWCHPTMSSFVTPFSSCPQSFPASGSFAESQVLATDSQSIGVLASPSVLPMNIQGWFPLGLTGMLSLLCKGLWRVFSSTTVWKHQFCGAQSPLWSNSHICTWLWKKLYRFLSMWIKTLQNVSKQNKCKYNSEMEYKILIVVWSKNLEVTQ